MKSYYCKKYHHKKEKLDNKDNKWYSIKNINRTIFVFKKEKKIK